MVKTSSTMMKLGTKASDFQLIDTQNNLISLQQYTNSKGYLIMFLCNHCPFVIHIQKVLSMITEEFITKGISVIAINSNDTLAYPEDNLEHMKKVAKDMNYSFPYLLDTTQEVAKAYQAACTPDFFLFDKDKKLVYRGQMDSSRPGNQIPVTGENLKQAVSLLLEKKAPISNQTPSIGCNIKWRQGNEPSYYP